MRAILNRALLALMIAVLLSGCAKETASQLNARFTAAKNIQDTDDRDKALDRIAIDAVQAGEGRLAMDACRGIVENGRRDRVARQCAQTLDARGDRATAQEFVQLISDNDMRDRMNKSFASDAPKAPPDTK